MTLIELRDKLLRSRTRNLASLDIPLQGAAPIEAERGYFQIRVAEMYLGYERSLWQKLAPAALCVCDFKYGADGKEVRVPFFVSNRMFEGVAEGGGDLGKVRIRLRDTRVLGPVPFRGGDVGLFAGLYRTVVEDERKALFSLFDKLLGVAHAGSFLPYVQLAEKISDELSTLLGMEAVQCVVAERQVFGQGARPLRSGHLAIFSCEEQRLAGVRLEVDNGSLKIVEGAGSRAFDLCDYCLLRIETSDTRDDVTTLPFHQKWKQARASLLSDQLGPARAALVECQRLLLDSEDLTEDHRNKLLEFYQAAFLQEHKRIEQASAADGVQVRGERKAFKGARGGETAVELLRLAEVASHRPRLVEPVARIQTLVAGQALPRMGAGAAEDDSEWEEAIQRHLRKESGAQGTRKSATALAMALADAMVAPRS